jgi:N-acetylmuramoyl-L-alanine amidase
MFLADSMLALQARNWQVYKLGGREYVSDENVAKFYGFQRFAKEGDNRIFKHPDLKERGFKTLLTRRNDVFLTLGQRVAIANRQKDAIFISVHFNSSGSRDAHGIETYALAPQGTRSTNGGSRWNSPLSGNLRDAENIALATAVHAHVIKDMRSIDRGIKRARFNVLRGINKPAILFEGGFVTNRTEGKLINDPAHRQRIVDSIANAVVKFRTAVGKK